MIELKSEKQHERTCADCVCSPVCDDSLYGYGCFWWQPNVIHCRECRHYVRISTIRDDATKTCDIFEFPMLEDDYCSYGEKTEGEKT